MNFTERAQFAPLRLYSASGVGDGGQVSRICASGTVWPVNSRIRIQAFHEKDDEKFDDGHVMWIVLRFDTLNES